MLRSFVQDIHGQDAGGQPELYRTILGTRAVGGSLAGRGSITWVREQLAAVLGQSLSTVSGSGGSSVE